MLLDFGLFWIAFRVLTTHDVSWSSLWDGAVAAAIGYEVLQLLGGYYVGRVLKNAANVYGTFALVIGLLSFIYLAVRIALLGAEVNVVAARRLWPRSLLSPARAKDLQPSPVPADNYTMSIQRAAVVTLAAFAAAFAAVFR